MKIINLKSKFNIIVALLILASLILFFAPLLFGYLTPYGVSNDLEARSVYQIAIQKKDISICDKIHITGLADVNSKELQNNCYAAYAAAIPSQDICGRIGQAFECVSARAKALNDASLCLSITKPGFTAYCVGIIAHDMGKKTVCQILPNISDQQSCARFFNDGN